MLRSPMQAIRSLILGPFASQLQAQALSAFYAHIRILRHPLASQQAFPLPKAFPHSHQHSIHSLPRRFPQFSLIRIPINRRLASFSVRFPPLISRTSHTFQDFPTAVPWADLAVQKSKPLRDISRSTEHLSYEYFLSLFIHYNLH